MTLSLAGRRWPALLALLSAGALAGSHEGRATAVPLLPRYLQECGACHLAYPPSMLPAAAWQQLITGLPQHFGTDASMDAPTAAALSAWLAGHGATGRRAELPPDLRITRAAWFQREHRELDAAVWKRPGVKSAARCSACHSGAEQGDFDEHRVSIPR
jgi:hypothetical protein